MSEGKIDGKFLGRNGRKELKSLSNIYTTQALMLDREGVLYFPLRNEAKGGIEQCWGGERKAEEERQATGILGHNLDVYSVCACVASVPGGLPVNMMRVLRKHWLTHHAQSEEWTLRHRWDDYHQSVLVNSQYAQSCLEEMFRCSFLLNIFLEVQ